MCRLAGTMRFHVHVPQSSGTDPTLIQLLREGQSNSDARHNAQESYLQNLGMTLGNAVRHMQSNGAGLNSISHNLSQDRGGTTVEIPARSSNSPPPSPPPAVGAIAIGGSSSSSVARNSLARWLVRYAKRNGRHLARQEIGGQPFPHWMFLSRRPCLLRLRLRFQPRQ